MIETMVGVIGKVGIFMICAQTVIYCRPKPVYEKYLKLLVSLIALVLLLDGVFSLFLKGTDNTQNGLLGWEDYLAEENGQGMGGMGVWQDDEWGEWTGGLEEPF